MVKGEKPVGESKGLSNARLMELRKEVKPVKIGAGWYSWKDGKTVARETEIGCLKYFSSMRGKE